MTGNLRVTPEKLIAESANFAQCDSSVNQITQEMMNIVNELNTTWAGDAATGYYSKLKGLAGDMEKLHKMIQEHTKDLSDMAKTYQDAEKANAEAANALKTADIV